MIRLLGWPIRRVGIKTLLVLALLAVALGSVALGLSGAVRGLNAGLLLPVAALGLLVGWGLAKSPLPGWLGSLLVLGLGLEVVFVRMGRLGGPLLVLLVALVNGAFELVAFLLWGAWRLDRIGWSPNDWLDWSPILMALEELWAKASTLLIRLSGWFLGLVTGKPVLDIVAVALVWSLVLWAIAAWAAWWVRRRDQPLHGVAPAGVLLSVSLFYVRGDPAFLLPFLGAGLLLMVLVGHFGRERRWDAVGVDFPVDLGLDVAVSGAALSMVLVSMAMLAPAISLRQVIQWAEGLGGSQEREVQLVSGNPLGLEPQVSAPLTIFDQEDMRAPGLPRRHLIGSGPELSQQVVMIIYPQENGDTGDDVVTDLSSQITSPYYWRSLTYDKYTGRGWITVETETHRYQAGDLALYRDPYEPAQTEDQAVPDDWLVRRKVQLEVRAVGDWRELVHTAGDLVTVDQDFRIAWRSSGDGFGASLISTDRAPRTEGIPGEIMEGSPTIYQVDSLVPVVGQAQLRVAGSDYPAWVEYRYLALPDNIPPRVLALARDLTATAPTSYDRALAIEKYLRTFPYNLDLPFPPARRDIVDYFLFDLQEGYCDYYATSMVVLARAAGLPARLAVGYVSGTYDEANARYLVTEADAHAWAEIYFPGYGWIEFEPTAGRPPIERPAVATPMPPPDLEDLEPKIAKRAGGVGLWWLVLVGLTVSLGLAGVVWSLVGAWRLRRLSSKAAVAELYWRFYRQGRWLAVPARPGDTPYEFVESFAERLMGLAGAKGWRTVLTPAAEEARSLAELYVQTCYGPDSPDAVDRGQMMSAWRRLRWRLWLARVRHIGSLVSDLTSVSSRPAHRVEHLPTS